eukprot:4524310-Pyramimonas_sp.AAC.2
MDAAPEDSSRGTESVDTRCDWGVGTWRRLSAFVQRRYRDTVGETSCSKEASSYSKLFTLWKIQVLV